MTVAGRKGRNLRRFRNAARPATPRTLLLLAELLAVALLVTVLGCRADSERAEDAAERDPVQRDLAGQDQAQREAVNLTVVASLASEARATDPVALQSADVTPAATVTLTLALEPDQYGELYLQSRPSPSSNAASGPQLIAQEHGVEPPKRMLIWKGGVGRPLCWVGNAGEPAQLNVRSTRPFNEAFLIEAGWANVRQAIPGDRKRCVLLRELAEAEATLHHDNDRRALELLGAVVATAAHHGDPETLAYAWLETAHARGTFSVAVEAAKAAQIAAEHFAAAGLEAERLDALNQAANAHLESQDAIETLEQVLTGQRALGNGYGELVALNTLALAYMRQHNPSQAFTHYLAAYDRAREIGDLRQQSLTLHNAAEMFLRLGDFTRTIEFSERALPIHQQLNDLGPAAHAYEHLFEAFMARGELAKAREMIDRAVALSRQMASPYAEARALEKLAGLLAREGEHDLALDHYRRALEVFTEYEILDRRALSLAGLASVYTAKGDLDRARSLHLEALEIQGSSSLSAIPSLSGLARIHHLEGDVDGALGFMQRAVALVESSRNRVADEDLRAHYFATQRHLYDFIVELQLERRREGDVRRAFAAVQQAKARSWVDVLNRSGIYSTLPPDLEQRASANRRALSQRLAAAIPQETRGLSAPDAAPRGAFNGDGTESKTVAELRTEWGLLRQEMRTRGARTAAASFAEPASIEEVQQRLRASSVATAFVEFHVARTNTRVFVITASEVLDYTAPGSEVLSASVEELRNLISTPQRRSWNRLANIAHRLYSELLGPAQSMLQGIEEMVVAADGPLLGLPMAVLLTEPAAPNQSARDLAYAAHRWSFRQVPSATAWTLRADVVPSVTSFKQRATALIVASESAAGSVSHLPHAQSEASTVADLYREPHLWVGRDASETQFKSAAITRSARVLHLAVHADANEARPAESALLMADRRVVLPEESARGGGASVEGTAVDGTAVDGGSMARSAVEGAGQRTTDNGLLTAEELSTMSFSADLVVLSACGSGLGENVAGEGYLGLTRSFQLAGARQVLASLWRVADESTAQLMIAFHRRLQSHGDPARALKEAQGVLIQSNFAHPYYWAPFVLNG